MSPERSASPAVLYPFMCYQNPAAAIDWLCEALGFEKRMVVPGPDGTIVHAELQLGDGVIMLGTGGGPLGLTNPRSLGTTTQGVYIALPDVDACYARAVAAGAAVVMDLHDTDYGSRDFSIRDPEGHLWSFGTYRP